MSSFPEQEVSFVSGRSSRSSSYKPKTRRLQPYVSPFVIEANKRAKQRVRETYAKYSPRRRESSPPVHDSGEWNNNVQTPGLFDPRLRKQEIFRLGPKSSKQSDTNTFDSARMHQQSTNISKESVHNRPAQRLTVRTDGDSPRRNPQAYGNRGSHRADQQVRIFIQELTILLSRSSNVLQLISYSGLEPRIHGNKPHHATQTIGRVSSKSKSNQIHLTH